MGTLVTRQLAAGWTFGTQKAAILDLLTEAWGPFVYRKQGTNAQALAEFPKFVDAYMCLNFVTQANAVNLDVARTLEVLGDDFYTRVFKRHSLTVSDTSTNTANALQLIAVTGPNYRFFQARAGSVKQTVFVVTLQNMPGYWGSKSRNLSFTIGSNRQLFSGDNPWGNFTEGQTSVASADVGEINCSIRFNNLPSQTNSLLTAHQVTRNVGVHNAQGSAGSLPPDLVFISGTVAELPIWKPISVPKPGGSGETDTYVVFHLAALGIYYGVKIDQPWTLLSPAAAGYIIDDDVPDGINPATGEPVPLIVEPHPARLAIRGQIHPSPWGLPAPGTPKP